MIRQSFVLLEGIKARTEQNIWMQGVKTWDDFLKRGNIKGISAKRKIYHNLQLLNAKKALFSLDSSYFLNRLPNAEAWRLYDFFREEALFLDIEVSGVKCHDYITVFGLFDGFDTKIMIKSFNLDYKLLKRELSRYKLIVTFNGSSFDIPFIRKRYPDLLPNVPNFDVMSVICRAGFSGGLKEIEKSLGIRRNPLIERFCSGDPYRLYRMYKATGDDYYLKLLIEYNEDDLVNLKKIAELCVKRLTPS